jgi:hypothetical protein
LTLLASSLSLNPPSTVEKLIASLPSRAVTPYPLPAPKYTPNGCAEKIGLAVESMKRHMSDEGWQIFQGLEHNGYELFGYALPNSLTDVTTILQARSPGPGTMLVQDKREWLVQPGNFREPLAKFHRVSALKERPDIFKLTIVKDAHHDPHYHLTSAQEMGVNAWVIYYHPKIVKHLATYTRPQHLIRTYHSLDPNLFATFRRHQRQDWCCLSGAISQRHYPMRWRLFREYSFIPGCRAYAHPGYHRDGTNTPEFLDRLTRFKVAICTASIYGYALRKFMEASAAGCIVVTDLPTDEVLPEIDDNLVRVSPLTSTADIGKLVARLYREWDEKTQKDVMERARAFYDYRAVTKRLAEDIERARQNYVAN